MLGDEELGRQMNFDEIHDLREGLALTKGWLELVFRNWHTIEDERRLEMVAGALFGANRVAFVLDMVEGQDPETLQSPQDRMAEEFQRLIEGPETPESNGSRGGRRTIR